MLDGDPRVLRIQDAFERDRAVPDGAVPVKLFPGGGRAELPGGEGGERDGIVLDARHPDKVTERGTRVAQHRPEPGDASHHVEYVSGGDPWRQGQAVADVALAMAELWRIDGDDQRTVAGRLRPIDQRAHDLAVPPDVQLEPARPGRRGGDVFHRADRHRA